MSKPLLTLVLVAVVCELLAVTARAQEHDPAAAQALFDQARSLMDAGRYAEACGKLAESQRLDPGIGTQFNLAVCYEQEGRLASAWATFLEVASLANASGQQARAQAAARRASLLESRLPRLKIVVSPEAQVAGLEIRRDGVIVGEAQRDIALPVDPGPHSIDLAAPNRQALTRSVSASAGAVTTFEVPVLEATKVAPEAPAAAQEARGSAAPEAAAKPAVRVEPAPVQRAHEDVEPGSGPGGVVIALGIVGVVAIGGGSALGLAAMSKNDASRDHCEPDDRNRCSPEGVDLRDDAFLFANIATGAFIVGGVALAAGAVLWLTRSPEATAGPAVAVDAGPSAARVSVRGTF